MIQANELRLGNWVDYKGKYYQIYDGIRRLSIDDLDSESLDSHLKNIKLLDLRPIALTEEILLMCGFVLEDQMYNYFTHQDIPGIFQLFDGVAEYSIDSNDVCWVNSLHQLQNLYLALIGEELNIEL